MKRTTNMGANAARKVYRATAATPARETADRHRALVERAVAHMRARPGGPHRLDEFAGLAGYGRSYFCRLFAELVGRSFKQFSTDLRIGEAKRLLLEEVPAAEVARRVSFKDASHFRERFLEIVGVGPAEWLSRHSR